MSTRFDLPVRPSVKPAGEVGTGQLESARGGYFGCITLPKRKPTLNCCGAGNSNGFGITTECVNPTAGLPTPKLRNFSPVQFLLRPQDSTDRCTGSPESERV